MIVDIHREEHREWEASEEAGNLWSSFVLPFFVGALRNLETDIPIPTKKGKDWRKYPLL